MANTQILKEKVEPYVRKWLSELFGDSFHPKFLILSRVQGPAGTHEFDAVSSDEKIVAGIISSGGKTSSGKNPSGKLTKAVAEIYYLSLVDAEKKLLVLTDAEFSSILNSKMEGRLVEGVKILHCPLPKEMASEVAKMRAEASKEVGG